MDGKRVYLIEINGIKESIDAIESLNQKLLDLSNRIDELNNKQINIAANTNAEAPAATTTQYSSRKADLTEEERVLEEIEKVERKIAEAETDAYKELLRQKDVLKEIKAEQKAFAGAEKLGIDPSAIDTSVNSMAALKQELKDLKAVINATDMNSPMFKDLVQKANELNSKLKEIEQSYGQFGRNVGNYASAAEGFKGFSIQVNGVTREFDNATQAAKTLDKELKTLAAQGKKGTEEFENLREVVSQLKSDINDAAVSSKAMDEALDMFESFTSIASAGQGITAFFGFDSDEIDRSIQKLVSLQNTLQSIEKIRQQMSSKQGIGKIFTEGNQAIDSFVAKITGAEKGVNGLIKGSKAATIAVRGLSVALKGIGIGVAVTLVLQLVEGLSKMVESLNTAKAKEEALENEMKATDREFEHRKQELSSSYLSNAISSEEYLAKQFQLENDYLAKQIDYLKERGRLRNQDSTDNFLKYQFSPSGEANTAFTGNKFTKPVTLESWNLETNFNWTVKDINEAREAWKKLNEAQRENLDYYSKYGKGPIDFFNSLRVTVEQTKDLMHGFGNVVLSDFVGSFEELQEQFQNGEIDVEKYRAKLREMIDLMNSDEIIKSVLANLPDYIKDEESEKRLNNIIAKIRELNDEFNKTSPQTIHYWNQVRIDGMKEGDAKILAQLQEDERMEIQQYAKTEEDKDLIRKKYNQKRLTELKKNNSRVAAENKRHRKEELDAEKELNKLKIDAMKDGLNKTLTQLKYERQQRIAEAEASNRLVNEKIAEINKLYDEKIFNARIAHHNALIAEEKRYAKELESVIDATHEREYEISHGLNERRTYQGSILEELEKAKDDLKVLTSSQTKIFDTSFEAYKILLEQKIQETQDQIRAFTANLEIDYSDSTIQNLIKLNDEYTRLKYIVDDLKESNEKTFDGKTIEEYEKELDKVGEKIDKIIHTNVEYYNLYKDLVARNLEDEYALRKEARDKYFKESLDKYKKYLEQEEKLESEKIDKSVEKQQKEETERYSKSNSTVFEEDAKEEVKSRFELIRKQVQYTQEAIDSGVLKIGNVSFDGKYFEDYIKNFNKWIDTTRDGLKKGKNDWADYQEFFESSNFKTYQKAYDDYNEFITNYNKLSKNEQEKQAPEAKKQYDALVTAYVSYIRSVENEADIHKNAMKTITEQGEIQKEQIRQEYREKDSVATAAYYRRQIDEAEEYSSIISNKLSNPIQKSSFDLITPFNKANELKDIKTTLKNVYSDILQSKMDFENKWKKGEISFEEYEKLKAESDIVLKQLGYLGKEVKDKEKGLVDSVVQTINQYVQAGLQAVQTLMDAYSDYEDYKFDMIQEQIDRTNDMLEKQLDKQEEIVRQHKENIDSIEDELASARGDRRQYLIDQLNNEILAQREAAAEEARIKKQQEAMEIKQEKLDRKRKEKEYKNNLANIIISTAMATANGLATQPFVPVGIAMGSLATALGMVQYELAKRQKPFERGGQLEGGLVKGPRHSQGGVPVGNTGIEVEGDEMIIRRKSTMLNLPLLDYINKSQRRLDLEDMVEFFNHKTRKTITEYSKKKFADGGQLKMNNINIEGLGSQPIIIRDDATYQVSVVDIANAQDRVKNVQVLAGLNN